MELQEALLQVSEIRRQMDRSETFRGYRSITAGLSAVVALGAAAVQPAIVPDPRAHPDQYLKLWILAAFVSVAITAGEMIVRCHRLASPMATRLMLLAVEQFAPCVIAGGSVTLVLGGLAPEGAQWLPGLWGVIFSLGLFASARVLPRPVFFVAVYYLICGLGTLALARGAQAFSPWSMAITFGGGQALTAMVLYITLEHRSEEEQHVDS